MWPLSARSLRPGHLALFTFLLLLVWPRPAQQQRQGRCLEDDCNMKLAPEGKDESFEIWGYTVLDTILPPKREGENGVPLIQGFPVKEWKQCMTILRVLQAGVARGSSLADQVRPYIPTGSFTTNSANVVYE